MKLLFLTVFGILAAVAEDVLPSIQELRNGNLVFSAKTYSALAKLNNDNFLVCPLSVSIVLALVETGSGGITAQQLLSGLNLPDSNEKTEEAYKATSPSLNVNKEYILTSANKIYLKNNFEVNPKFKQIATDVFDAEVESIDFNNEEAVSKINGWVQQKTNDKIKNIVARKDIDKDTRAVLINALFFQGYWLKPFCPEETQKKTFTALNKKEIKVNMMEQTSVFNYYEDEKLNAKFLQLSYHGDDISMTFVLPNDVEGLSKLETNIEELLKTPQYTTERVHVQIPNINIETTIDFIPILKQFGIKEVFSPDADLSGIEAHGERLFVSKVLQKTFIGIAENGTTAAAATVVMILPGSPAPPPLPPKEFNAKHSFLFYLKYRYGILFIGRYVGSN